MQPEDVINTPIKPEDFSSKSISVDNAGMSDDLELDDEIDPIGDMDFDDIDDEDFGISDDEFNSEIDMDNDLDLDLTDDKPQPNVESDFKPAEQIVWTTQTQNDNTIVSRHKDGFVLMAKRLSSQSGNKHKYISRLSRDGRIIDSGTVWVDDNKDPTEYLQNLSDRILDRGGLAHITKELTDKSEPDKQDDAGGGGLGGGQLGGGLDIGGDMDLGGDLGGDLDLGDEDLEIDDEEADIDIEED